MKIVTWNVNSIRARQQRLVAWLAAERPDVVCLQELKVVDEAFPYEPILEAATMRPFSARRPTTASPSSAEPRRRTSAGGWTTTSTIPRPG